jgi:hypothetical protein
MSGGRQTELTSPTTTMAPVVVRDSPGRRRRWRSDTGAARAAWAATGSLVGVRVPSGPGG